MANSAVGSASFSLTMKGSPGRWETRLSPAVALRHWAVLDWRGLRKRENRMTKMGQRWLFSDQLG